MRNPIDAAKAATDAFLAMLAAFANYPQGVTS